MINSSFLRVIKRFSTQKYDPYKILQIPPTASAQQIKASYYKLAKQHHPDISPRAAELFKQINKAYNLLKDQQKRRQFQKQETKANGEGKEGDDGIKRSYYDSKIYYGSKGYKQKNQSKNYHNPFASRQPIFQNQFSKDFVNRSAEFRQRNLNKMRGSVKTAILIGFGIVSTIIVFEVILGIYQATQNPGKIGSLQGK